ncbi:MAG: AEC family transporter [Nitratireductor sp.]|nr:AEC family transporter [Nitratireductor sp.]
MLAIFESLLPVFLLIALGAGLKSARLIEESHWTGVERISYFVFFPSLLVHTLYNTDFATIPASRAVLAFCIGLVVILSLALLLRLPFRKLFGIDDPSYSSVAQGFLRWNAFVGLAIAEKVGSPAMFTVIALGIAVLAIPINIASVSVVARLGSRSGETGGTLRLVSRNPLVIGTAIGLALNFSGVTLYAPFAQAIELCSRVSLPIGLILVGAGLRLIMPRRAMAAAAATCVLKLAMVPLVYASAAYALGLRGEELISLAIAGSVPTAMNGYLVARDLGGDAPLYAAIVTMQTIAAFFTIPLVVLTATYLAG